jgi:probable F420-dependent oxidoreductase
MKIGLILPHAAGDTSFDEPRTTLDWPGLRSFAQTAEQRGIDSLWVFDHLLSRSPTEPDQGMHEAWTILAGVAAVTSRVELGSLVMCTSFRNPGLLAKMAATLDEISAGRLILGLGCGWHDPEYEAFGYPTDHKVGRFEESLEVIRRLLAGEAVSIEGRWLQTDRAKLLPPARRPDLPILIAAKGPRMLELTARHAAAWNTAWFAAPDERFRTRLADLRAACASVGRDPATIDVTVGIEVRRTGIAGPADEQPGSVFVGSPDQLADSLRGWQEAGADHVIAVLSPATTDALDWFAAGVALYRSA